VKFLFLFPWQLFFWHLRENLQSLWVVLPAGKQSAKAHVRSKNREKAASVPDGGQKTRDSGTRVE
jgi:hypothetical protein